MINIITLKTGTLYNHEYVNKMYSMVKRHLSKEFRFYCLTEDSTNLDENIIVVDLPNMELKGWWFKPYIFKENLFSTDNTDTNFFLDLDMVLIDNIDCYFEYNSDSTNIIGLRDLIYTRHQHVVRLGSAILRWKNNTYSDLWTRIEDDISNINGFPGDQDYIWKHNKESIEFFPTEWTTSFKWELIQHGLRKQENMIVFHGVPKPHEVSDPLITQHWR